MMRRILPATALVLALGTVHAAPAGAGAPRPFSAHYLAQWKDISVGVSDLVLVRGTDPGRYVYTWRISARGIFRLFYRHDVVQKSWLRVEGAAVRPEIYEAEDGSSRIHMDFDWARRSVRGTLSGKPLDLALKAGTQDLMSIQIQVMQDLRQGRLPAKFWIIDKDQIKDFDYHRAGEARIQTELGDLDTIVVTSRRPGGNRVLTMWFAPSLGFVPVQATRTRGGKLEFAMRIEKLSH
ncbi:MAG TPA: DUF3108 domain-containing protein [Steroidobacteraceae bacterium]|nr:DUF3108 domain-containing protein [Steroidobacteraceae bacterium]